MSGKVFTLILLAVCVLTGCNTLFRGTPETIPGHTNVVVSVQPDGALVTNVISRPTVTITNLVKGEAFDTAKAVGGVLPLYGEVAVTILGLAGGIYLDWRNRKNKRVGVSTIQGIDQFRTALQASGEKGIELDEKLKTMLKNAHLEAGVKEIAAKMVEVHTSKKDQPEDTEEVRKLL